MLNASYELKQNALEVLRRNCYTCFCRQHSSSSSHHVHFIFPSQSHTKHELLLKISVL